MQQSVAVETNDPNNRAVRLTMKGTVTAEVTVTPRYVNFGSVTKEDPRKPIELRIECRPDRKIRIREVRSMNPAILVSRVREDETGAVYEVSLAENLPLGRVTGEILVRTTGRKTPEVKVPVHAMVQGGVNVVPQLLSLGSVTAGKPVTRQITLTKTGQDGFRVLEVKKTTDRLTCEVLPEKEGERYRVQVTYHPGEQTTGRIAERLTIVIGNGQEETIEVPVFGALRPAEQERPAN